MNGQRQELSYEKRKKKNVARQTGRKFLRKMRNKAKKEDNECQVRSGT